MATGNLSPGDEWPGYYRGYRLHTNADREVWWQVYQGTDKLSLDPTPEQLVEQLLSVKRLGGRVRVTEGNDVIARRERGDSYETVWVGELSLEGKFVPSDDPEYGVQARPKGLSPGDLWPSVYDGSKYSFDGSGDRIWWQNPDTGKRHPVATPIPSDVIGNLRSYKPDGGSFRVTPWNDVVTLVPTHPAPEQVREQFRELPRVVKNIIKLRKERGVEMLPVYVGRLDNVPLRVDDPVSLTDSLSDEEQSELESWAGSLGRTSSTTASNHRAGSSDSASGDSSDSATDTSNDDPADW
jgi:hypothetical protein